VIVSWVKTVNGNTVTRCCTDEGKWVDEEGVEVKRNNCYTQIHFDTMRTIYFAIRENMPINELKDEPSTWFPLDPRIYDPSKSPYSPEGYVWTVRNFHHLKPTRTKMPREVDIVVQSKVTNVHKNLTVMYQSTSLETTLNAVKAEVDACIWQAWSARESYEQA
jgi:hypothetical protein